MDQPSVSDTAFCAMEEVSLDSPPCMRRQSTLGFSLARGRSSLSMKFQGSA
jgi:hypothetical protein